MLQRPANSRIRSLVEKAEPTRLKKKLLKDAHNSRLNVEKVNSDRVFTEASAERAYSLHPQLTASNVFFIGLELVALFQILCTKSM